MTYAIVFDVSTLAWTHGQFHLAQWQSIVIEHKVHRWAFRIKAYAVVLGIVLDVGQRCFAIFGQPSMLPRIATKCVVTLCSECIHRVQLAFAGFVHMLVEPLAQGDAIITRVKDGIHTMPSYEVYQLSYDIHTAKILHIIYIIWLFFNCVQLQYLPGTE